MFDTRLYIQNVTDFPMKLFYAGMEFNLDYKGSFQALYLDTLPANIVITANLPDDRYINTTRQIFSGEFMYESSSTGNTDNRRSIEVQYLDEELGVLGYRLLNIGGGFKPHGHIPKDLLFRLENFNSYVRAEGTLQANEISYPYGYIDEGDYSFEYQQTSPYIGFTERKPTIQTGPRTIEGVTFVFDFYNSESSPEGAVLKATFNNPEIIPIASLKDLQEVANLGIATFAAGTPMEVKAFASKISTYKQINHIICGPDKQILPPNSIFFKSGDLEYASFTYDGDGYIIQDLIIYAPGGGGGDQ